MRFAPLVLSLALVACGQAVTPSRDATTATDADDAVAPTDTMRVDAATARRRSSYVRLEQTAAEFANRGWLGIGSIIDGAFFLDEPTDDHFQFQERVEGACRLRSSISSATVGAGMLTIQGTGTPTILSSLRGTAGPIYVSTIAMLRWAPGEALRVAITGDVVPPFATTVSLPAAITLESPALVPVDVLLPVRAADGLELRWQGAPPLVSARIVGYPPGDHAPVPHAWCDFPGASGRAVLSPTVLAAFVGASSVQLVIASEDRIWLRVGNFDVEVTAANVVYITGLDVR
jgi:hypothetical protein